jgi:hypothetical protein
MKRALPFLVVIAVFIGLTSPSTALAQGGSARTSLSGLVSDKTGGVIPGASVDVKNNATGVSNKTITNSTGQFNVPALDPGTYTVTVTLQGFKTAIVKDVILIVGSPGNVPVTLEVGTVGEAVEVNASSSLVQTQSTAVSSTINLTQIQNLPLTSRNALFGFVIMLPGVSTPGAPRDSTLFGLPETSINITIDGVNTNNNFQRDTDGFYSMVFPQLDAVEQVTVTGAGAGAEGASMGSVAIRFATRSGTNRYTGTGYYYMRRPGLNSNDFFSDKLGLPKTQLKLNQFGISQGGPIKLPGYDGSGRAFFFVNYEEFYQPTSTPLRTRQLLNEQVAGGLFRYNVSSGGSTITREVNVLTLAAGNGQTSTIDPTFGALLAQMRSLANDTVAAGTGVISNTGSPVLDQLDLKIPGKYVNHLPTTRVDFNLSQRHRLSGSYWWQMVNRFPDIQNSTEAQIPGLPNYGNYRSIRTVGSITLRSTLSAEMVNEVIGGWQWSPGTFNADVVSDMFANQGGYSLSFPLGATAATRTTNPNSRYQTNVDFKDTLSWLRGNHSMSMGAGFTRVTQHNVSENVVPTITFGIQTGLDPADAMFTTGNFPGASTGDLNSARSLYAHLTGRVTQVGATAFLNEGTGKYEYLGVQDSRGYQDTWNAFIQDSWKLKPTITLNGGVAWVVQLPFAPGNSTFSTTDMASFCGPYGQNPDGYCKGLYQVGGDSTIGKQVPEFNELTKGTHGYKVDYKQFSPNIGIAWRPNVQSGFLRTILGDPEQATLRAGFSIGFNQPPVGTGVYGNNPGRSISATRNNNGSNYLLVGPGETWPVLFTETSRLGPPPGIDTLSPAYPILAVPGNSLNLYDPNLKTPYTKSYSVGLQRAVGQNMAVEVRYVGTQSLRNWGVEDWNDFNIYESGFLEEFKKAQSNLRATVAAGLCASSATCTFGYRGPGTGTVPLPIYLGYLNGSKDVNNPAAYTATNFTNTTFIGRLNMFQPQVNNAAADLHTTARLNNGLLAGFPANFWRMNPTVGTGAANMTMNGGNPSGGTNSGSDTKYDAFVVELRRRLSNGLLFSGSFTQAWRYAKVQNQFLRNTPQLDLRRVDEVPWAVKLTANYDIPFGRGRRFGTDTNKYVNGALGDWAVNVTGRVQAGTMLTQTGIILVGMSEKELQDMYFMRTDPATGIITMLPEDVILNTRRAFTTSATSADGYGALGTPTGKYIAPASNIDCVQVFAGDCGQRNFYLTGPVFTRFDFNAKKQFPFGGGKAFVFQLDILNLFNSINFNPVFNPGSGATIFQVNSAYQDISGTYDPGGRLMQLVFRINW